jgi:hypothetical protein
VLADLQVGDAEMDVIEEPTPVELHSVLLCGLTFELSGPTPEWRLAREADDDSGRLAGQAPCRWRSRSSEGLAVFTPDARRPT